jgi:oxygen-independent coproporphyrinogen-3 oxidase
MLKVDTDLLMKYDRSGPRYTSYPTAPYLTGDVSSRDFVQAIKSNGQDKNISLYFHLPFCDTMCHFCGCNMLLTRSAERIDTYLNYIAKEIKLLTQHFSEKRKVSQLHWGGGTPNSLSPVQIERLGKVIHEKFIIEKNAEVSVELDPRGLTFDHMQAFHDMGFNRCSMGIQDFNLKVQKAVNRVQSEKITQDAMDWARKLKFNSVNIDLIYGLPFQEPRSYEQTLERVIKMAPDRLAVFNYAHVPAMIKKQRMIEEKDLPAPKTKLQLLKLAIEKLTGAGYTYIGMDHFARPQDELFVALKEKTLYRNFQGYSTHAGLDLYSFGMSSISMLSRLYVQNHKKLKNYFEALDQNELPIARGVVLNDEDVLRRNVIMNLMCHFQLDKEEIANKYKIRFDEHFSESLKNLDPFMEDGLVELKNGIIFIRENGRLVIRNIAMNFDQYFMQKEDSKPLFSKTI